MSNDEFDHRDYKKLFHLCLEHSDKLVLILNKDLTFKQINHLAETTFGLLEDDVINKRIDQVLQSPRPSPFEIKQGRLTIKQEQTSHFESNRKFSISWKIIPTDLDDILFVTGEKFSETEHLDALYMENLVKYTPGFFYWKDKDCIYRGCNDEFAILAGLKSRHEVPGKTDYDLIWKDRAELYVNVDKAVIESGVARLEHVEEITVSGDKTISAITNKVPMRDNQGEVIGLLGITIDITHQKEIEKALAVARKKAEAASRAKDEFIRNMSHDIRTPLSGIIGMSSILEHSASNPEDKEHAHMVNISGEQLLALLNSVLDIIASGNDNENQVIKSAVDIRKLVQNIADLERPTILLKNLDLRISLPDQLPGLIETDEIKVHRILLNLLGNAVKFTKEGYIEIGVRIPDTGKKAPQVEFYIRDTGAGIPKEDIDKIYKKFYRGTPSHQGLYAGYGVGLHIVKRYIHLLKGSITVESQPGEGSQFTVSIPLKTLRQEAIKTIETTATPAVLAAQPAPLVATTIQVLLIEDNAIALKTAENLLSKMGVGFRSVATGSAAIELFKTQRFDLVLSDIGLPDLSGTDVARYFRTCEKERSSAPVPIIGLTAHSVQESQQEALESGMNEVLSKPVRQEQIADLIRRYNLGAPQTKATSATDIPAADKRDLPETDQQLFDLDTIPLFDKKEGIKNCGGEHTLRELLAMLINTELPTDKEKMQAAFEQERFADVEKIAHKIKGGAVYLGTLRMKLACQYLERYWKSGERQLFAPLYHQAIKVIDETAHHVVQWLKTK